MTLQFPDILVTGGPNPADFPAIPAPWDNPGVMIRAFLALILLLANACGLSLSGKRPKYSGAIQKPLWKVDDIMVDEVFIGKRIVFCRARTFASPAKHLYAFDAGNGKQLWISDFELDPGSSHFFVRDVLVIRGADSQMHSIVAATGKPSRTPFSQALRGVSVDEATYVVSPGRLVAYDNQRLDELWHAELKVEVSDGPIAAGQNVLVAGPADATRTVYAFDRKTGKPAWNWSVKGDASPMAADENALYYSSWAERNAFAVAVDANSGLRKWSHPLNNANLTASAYLTGQGYLLIRDNPPGKGEARSETGYVFRTLKCDSGEESKAVSTAWKYPNPIIYGSAIYASDYQSGRLLNEGGDAAPDSWLTAASLLTGKELWRGETVHYGVFTTPAAGEGIVAVGIQPYSPPVPKAGDPMPAGLWVWKATGEGRE